MLAARVAPDGWNDGSWHLLTQRMIALARDRGALTVLPTALMLSLAEELFAGSMWLTACAWAGALLHNGLGRYDDALVAAEHGAAHPDELGLANWSMVELVEAATRCGRPERATGAIARLDEIARACRTDWVLGVAARRRALLDRPDAAERSYRDAITRLGRTRMRTDLARAHLLYCEWLRRENRRVGARFELRIAHEMFIGMGGEGFAEPTRRELLATGETVRRRHVDRATDLTDQEAQIARLAVDGHTNPEIGTRLVLSPRTVDGTCARCSRSSASAHAKIFATLSATPAA
jgi:DNA-binding CsgD family transcriptional regulator